MAHIPKNQARLRDLLQYDPTPTQCIRQYFLPFVTMSVDTARQRQWARQYFLNQCGLPNLQKCELDPQEIGLAMGSEWELLGLLAGRLKRGG